MTSAYPLHNPSKNKYTYRSETFLKCVTVQGGRVEFKHDKESFTMTGDCLKSMDGKRVLVDAAFNASTSQAQLGRLTRS